MQKMTGFSHNKHKRGHWKKIADHWSSYVEMYQKAEQDSPLWYTEMTSTALLAAAAWRAGVPALCEPQVERNLSRPSHGRKLNSPGRVDLFLSMQPNGEQVEVKHANYSISKFIDSDGKAKLPDDFLLKLDTARENAATVKHTYAGLRTGLFCASIYKERDKNIDSRKMLSGITSELSKERDEFSFAFWHFFSSRSRPAAGDGVLSLGGFVVGRATARAYKKT